MFLVIKDGAIGMATEDYLADLMSEVWRGDVKQGDAWDRLLIQTPDMEAPALCYVETGVVDGKAIATFRSGLRLGPIRLRIEI